ncbi:TPA: hypothetical protein HA241_03655 [Candidatus Woesearchaeota archaeon]|nr:hypothetical protein [Candidatus Woesearchaeota archaeon]
MDNYLLLPHSQELAVVSTLLGFANTFFLGKDFVFLESTKKKDLLAETQKAKGKKIVFRPATEEMLRFALEKANVDIILGVEFIHSKDSLHYLRGGLDDILCRIAVREGKTIGFSFSDILRSDKKDKLLSRIAFNIVLCEKFGVKTVFSTFASTEKELRSSLDLDAVWRALHRLR